MNRSSLRSLFGRTMTACVAFLFLGASLQAQWPQAQDQAQSPGAPASRLGPEQLDNLVAPVALYPDQLLSQVLVASTYPLEVVQAQQWLQRNPGLSGSQAVDAAHQQDWDASVQALVAMPDVLTRLNSDIRWTTDLGNAFLAQQADVMAAVQRMRAKAQANGKLNSTPQETVTTESQGGQTAIQIVPANPEVVYVPYYDPMYVWGPPAWGAYPYFDYPAFGFGWGPGINIGLCFGGWGGWGWGWGGWGWGWGPNWFGGSVFVNTAFFNRYGFHGGWNRFGGGGFGGRAVWAHDPGHRLGVSYPNRQLAGRYQSASLASRANMIQRASARNSFGQSYGANRGGFQSNARNSFGQSYGGGNRSTFQSGPRNSFGQSSGQSYSGGNRGTFQPASPRSGAVPYGGSRPAFQGSQSYRGNMSPGVSRSYQAPQSQGRQSFQSAPRAAAPSVSRGFSGGGGGGFGGARSFGGGGGHSSGGGGGHGGGRR